MHEIQKALNNLEAPIQWDTRLDQVLGHLVQDGDQHNDNSKEQDLSA